MVCVAAVATGSATYAWFINNTKVTAESVNMTATTANTLLISPVTVSDGDFNKDRSWGTTAKMEYTGLDTIKPVSTVFAATSGSKVDGLDFFTDSGWASESNSGDSTAKGVGDGSYNASEFTTNDVENYYYKGSFEIKASQAGRLYLDSDTAIKMMKKEASGTSYEAVGEADNVSDDMIKSMRLALVVTDTSSKVAGQDANNSNSTDGVYVYQWDGTSISNNAYNTTLTSLNNGKEVDGVTNGIASATATGNTSSNAKVADFKDTKTIKNLTTDNKVKVLDNTTLVSSPTTNTVLASPDSATSANVLYNFNNADDTVRITAYIWMEGCDYDCNSSVVNNIQGHTVNCQLGFALAEPEASSSSSN